MRKSLLTTRILTILASTLIAASTVQMASGAERHHVRNDNHSVTITSEQFRNANNSMAQPQPFTDNSYSDGHAVSAPAGR